MENNTDKLINLLARAEVLRKRGLGVKEKIGKAKNTFYDMAQNQLEILRRKAGREGEKEKVAYLNLLKQRRLLT